ncbi:MAG: PAC2 family protein [Acidimicrobiales bacterium]
MDMEDERDETLSNAESRSATLIVAFQGWSDAGDAASLALDHLRKQTRAHRVATIDPDEYFDFTVVRPAIQVDRTGVRKLSWPDTRFYLAPQTDSKRDLLFCVGIEPQLRWKHFSRNVIRIAADYGVDKVITLGALASEVPHTRPTRVVGTTSDASLGKHLQMEPSRYEGPTGILGVLQSAFQTRHIPSISLWANVPHYVAQTPSPKAALALVQRTSALLERSIDVASLERASREYVNQIDELIANDDEILSYVSQLESESFETELDEDFPESNEPLEFASGDELAVEAERFLRAQDTDES